MGTSCLCSFIRAPIAQYRTQRAHTHTLKSYAQNDFYFNSRSQNDLWCFSGVQKEAKRRAEGKRTCPTRHASINIFTQFPNPVHWCEFDGAGVTWMDKRFYFFQIKCFGQFNIIIEHANEEGDWNGSRMENSVGGGAVKHQYSLQAVDNAIHSIHSIHPVVP